MRSWSSVSTLAGDTAADGDDGFTVWNMSTRLATSSDGDAIAGIYNEGIADRTATFETRPRTSAEVRTWFGDSQHPVIVVERDGEVVAFASTSVYRPRDCYSGVAEFGVRAQPGQLPAWLAAAGSA